MAKDFGYPDFINREDYASVRKFIREHDELLRQKKVIVFGAGVRGGVIGRIFTELNYVNFDYCDNNEQKWGNNIGEHKILSPSDLIPIMSEVVILISAESGDIVSSIEKQLVGMGFENNINLFSIPSKIYDYYMEEFLKPIRNHVLITGDCRFTLLSPSDDNTLTLSDILNQDLQVRGISKKVLGMHALCMRAQYHVFKAQIELGNIPQIFMLCISYETFCGTMHCWSNMQHAELIRRIYEATGSKDQELKEYVELTSKRTLENAEFFSMEQEAGLEYVSDKMLRLYLKMCFMYTPSPSNEGIIYLKKLLKLANEYDVKLLAFIPPLNHTSGESYYGKAFTESYLRGVSYFRGIVNAYDGEFLDQSFLLSEDGFYSKYDKNEIPNYEGRVAMADSLINYLEKNM